MRVLYLTDRLSLRGGADRHLLQVMGWAVEEGHRVTVACGRREAGVVLPEGVTVATVRGLASAVDSPARLSQLGALLERAELVHVQNVLNPAALRLAVAAGRAVVTVQDHRFFCPGPGKTLPDGRPCRVAPDAEACRSCLPDEQYRRRLVELTARRLQAISCARIVVLSRYMKEELEAAGIRRIAVIPPAVEPCAASPQAGNSFLLAGRLVSHKAPLDAVRAWKMAGRPLPLRVAGEGPLAQALEGATHLGWLGASELRRELVRARALLFPSRWQEPFGILGIEALACGTPVIVAGGGGTREWTDGGCVCVPPGDAGAMAEAMARLAADPALALELGRAGREMVRRRFGVPALRQEILDLYAECATPVG